MCSMQTPLPEEITNLDQMSQVNLIQTTNQLITYLAELTEVVEGKQSIKELGSINATEKIKFFGKATTLKETLLNDLADLTWYIKNKGVDEIENGVNYVKVNDVEAIINRLIP